MGYYDAYIDVTSDTLASKAIINASASYSKKFKYKNLLKVNGKYATEGVYKYIGWPKSSKTKKPDEIQHP